MRRKALNPQGSAGKRWRNKIWLGMEAHTDKRLKERESPNRETDFTSEDDSRLTGRFFPTTAGLLHVRCDPQNNFFFVRSAHELYTNGKAFRRLTDRDHQRRIAEQVEPLRIPHRVQILNFRSFDLPASLPVTKRRHRAHGTQQ